MHAHGNHLPQTHACAVPVVAVPVVVVTVLVVAVLALTVATVMPAGVTTVIVTTLASATAMATRRLHHPMGVTDCLSTRTLSADSARRYQHQSGDRLQRAGAEGGIGHYAAGYAPRMNAP